MRTSILLQQRKFYRNDGPPFKFLLCFHFPFVLWQCLVVQRRKFFISISLHLHRDHYFLISVFQVLLSKSSRIIRLSAFKEIIKKSTAAAGTVDIQFMPADKYINAKIGEPILDVAKRAGVEIPFKCLKGECGTCEVNINGKWVKSCQETVSPIAVGEITRIQVKPKAAATKKPSTFFSPMSFAEGVVNNALGVVGFVATAAKADDAFEARMAREAALAAKVQAAKEKKLRETQK